MTTKERFDKGLPYIDGDEEQKAKILHAAELCEKYNATAAAQNDIRCAMLSKMFGKVGKNVFIKPPIRFDYGTNIEIGDDTFINYNLTVLDCAPVKIGARCFIGPNCSIYAVTHPIDKDQRNTLIERGYPVTIGSDVWFGGSVVVLPNVKIGDGSVIGAGSVVTHDIPPNVVAAGNPCRVIREITDKDKVEFAPYMY